MPEHETQQTSSRDVRAVVALSSVEIETFLANGLHQRLRKRLPNAQWFDPHQTTGQAWAKLFDETRPEIVLSAWNTPSIPATAEGLRYVCHCVGSVRLVPRSLLAAGVKVTNWGSIAAPLVAEHALLLTLAALRSMPRWAPFMAEPFSHEDKNRLETLSLRGRRVSIHGFGRIARELIRLLRPFDVTISAYSIGVPADFMQAHGVRPLPSVEALADETDVLITCEALTEATCGSIGAAVLSRLPRGAVFVNVGRGAVVDETALATLATARGLRLAVDVYAKEPLALDSPLRKVPDALLSPHIAGPTLDWYPRCGEAAVENIERYLAGGSLENEVSLEQYDRST